MTPFPPHIKALAPGWEGGQLCLRLGFLCWSCGPPATPSDPLVLDQPFLPVCLQSALWAGLAAPARWPKGDPHSPALWATQTHTISGGGGVSPSPWDSLSFLTCKVEVMICPFQVHRDSDGNGPRVSTTRPGLTASPWDTGNFSHLS